jgi:hypothetical protein
VIHAAAEQIRATEEHAPTDGHPLRCVCGRCISARYAAAVPAVKTPTPAVAVRRHLAEHGLTQGHVYVAALTRVTVQIVLARLDRGDVTAARTELADLLEATRVLDETVEEARRKLTVAEGACPACGRLATDADPLVRTSAGWTVHRSHTTDGASGYFGTAVSS